jgi:hypothetical protein
MAKAVIDLHRDDAAVVIPIDALRNEGDTTYAWVVRNGTARRRNLTLGTVEGAYAQVLAGIAEGEPVIVTAPDTLETGTRVRIASQ